MLDQIIAAFERQDYPQVAQLLATLPPENPWKILYQARLWEVNDQWQQAEAAYRQLLQTDCGLKISTHARQRLQRLETLRRAQQQQTLAQATASPETAELGVLVLTPVAPAAKPQAAQRFARIMQLDPYLARMLLPSQGWRLFRTGAIGELQFYRDQLQAAGVPVFWQTLTAIQQISVCQIRYFEAANFQITIICESQELDRLSFIPGEVTQRVVGRLPIFEDVVDLDSRGRLQRKSQVQDHAQICDLHLPERGQILRCYDSGYQFNQGLDFTPSNSLNQQTSWANWNGLVQFLGKQFPEQPIWSDFQTFAETAIDHPGLLEQIPPHLDLFRRSPSPWDPAFHLYSSLLFLRNSSRKSRSR